MTDHTTSDLHFYHKNILRFNPETRKFNDVEHMTSCLVEQWNDVMTSRDVMYHLGDFSFGSVQQTINLLKQLRGNVVFIRGNHDRALVSALKAGHWGGRFTLLDYHEMRVNKTHVVMFHYPQLTWNRAHHGAVQLHGHCHGSVNHLNEDCRRTDVGYDSFGRILTLEEAVALTKAKPFKVVDHHGA